MDPTRLNASDDARLEALLREHPAPLADDGFSARVVAALPRRRRSRAPWCVALGALAGMAAAVAQIARGEPIAQAAADLSQGLAALGDPLVLLAAIIAALAAAYALRSDRRVRRWI
jgi:hypothetical protein